MFRTRPLNSSVRVQAVVVQPYRHSRLSDHCFDKSDVSPRITAFGTFTGHGNAAVGLAPGDVRLLAVAAHVAFWWPDHGFADEAGFPLQARTARRRHAVPRPMGRARPRAPLPLRSRRPPGSPRSLSLLRRPGESPPSGASRGGGADRGGSRAPARANRNRHALVGMTDVEADSRERPRRRRREPTRFRRPSRDPRSRGGPWSRSARQNAEPICRAPIRPRTSRARRASSRRGPTEQSCC